MADGHNVLPCNTSGISISLSTSVPQNTRTRKFDEVMATAKLNKEYALRLCGVGVIMLALSAWSIYDGAVAWPRENANMDKVRPKLIECCESGKTPDDFLSSTEERPGVFLLQTIFAEDGVNVPKHMVQELSTFIKPAGESDSPEARNMRTQRAIELFSKPIYSQGKINGQFIQAGVTFIFAIMAFFAVTSKRKITYTADDNGLSGTGFGSTQIPWGDVASVNWDKWEEKGIINLSLRDGRTFKLDGWHFAGMRPIADILREKVK